MLQKHFSDDLKAWLHHDCKNQECSPLEMVFIIRAGAHRLAWHLQIKIMRRLAQICFFRLAKKGWFHGHRSRHISREAHQKYKTLVFIQHTVTLSNIFYTGYGRIFNASILLIFNWKGVLQVEATNWPTNFPSSLRPQP